nr:D-inositol-3-phosphate glycosyltransferase [uncultured bacterium]
MLALVGDAFGGRGGISQYNRDFLGAVAKSGLDVLILPRNAPDPYFIPNNIRQTRPWPGKVRYSVYALQAALRTRVDVVFCGHLFMASLAMHIARLKGAKLIVQTHGIEAWPRPTVRQREAVESADLVLSVSRHTRAAVLTWAALDPARVIVLPNTVRSEFVPEDGSRIRATLGMEGKHVLLTVARMDSQQQYKGQDRMIAWMPRLVELGHDVYYLIAGEGDDRPRLEALARERGVHDRVRFLGPLPTRQLKELYQTADLYVMPSTGEGFGIAFLEAMATGIPAAGLDVGGSRDVLADGELGICVPEVEFLDAIDRALTAPNPDPNELAKAARARFGRDKFGAGIQSVLNRLREPA